eukprot:TRINITY_DN1862_c0_g1_i1.p1 TRINITY_DN1862_c0_g1~~TRINITY_DN1862_c0_g1_i1.p1  ORF type:complete len:124 (-),score=20.44 TRINITY_DN1862_c0_g1_i1:21-392(-)
MLKECDTSLKRLAAKVFFLLTDIRDGAELKSDFYDKVPVTVHRLPTDFHHSHEGTDLFTEMAVAVMANYFIAGGKDYLTSSSPAREIMEMRWAVGHNPDSSFWSSRHGQNAMLPAALKNTPNC